jgi:predicted DNA binding CopG/RHH family protein
MNSKTQGSEVSVEAHAAGQRYAETKIKYTNESLGDVKVIPDFLPSIAELAFNEEGVKITLALSKKSVDFFKSEADKNHTQYQRMIRRLLDAYVDAHSTRSVP